MKADGKIRLKVRLYKYTRSSTARILGLNDGGSSTLTKFISSYKKETDKFTAPGLRNAVVILYDNDIGAVPIRNAIKNASHATVHGTEPFVHVVANLYAVPTPFLNGSDPSKIEDFFDAALKTTQVRGKTFNDANGYNTATQYGKSIFAHEVVRPAADTINFDGFQTLLTNVAAAIAAHTAVSAGAAPPVR